MLRPFFTCRLAISRVLNIFFAAKLGYAFSLCGFRASKFSGFVWLVACCSSISFADQLVFTMSKRASHTQKAIHAILLSLNPLAGLADSGEDAGGAAARNRGVRTRAFVARPVQAGVWLH